VIWYQVIVMLPRIRYPKKCTHRIKMIPDTGGGVAAGVAHWPD